jgi:glycyl-tRNA synthetase beta chain
MPLGVIRMLIERDLPLDLDALLSGAFQFFGDSQQQAMSQRWRWHEFIYDRLAGSLREQGYSAQEVDAVVSLRPSAWAICPNASPPCAPSPPCPKPQRWRPPTSASAISSKKPQEVDAHVSEVLLKEPAEIALYAAMKDVAPKAAAQFDAGDYTASLQTLAGAACAGGRVL